MSKTLHLNLKKQWFDMIASGEKQEEYRELKIHWARILLYRIYTQHQLFMWAWSNIEDKDYECQGWNIATGGAPTFNSFDTVTFRNGYKKNAPEVIVELKEIKIALGEPKWGALKGEHYFTLSLGKIKSIKNYDN